MSYIQSNQVVILSGLTTGNVNIAPELSGKILMLPLPGGARVLNLPNPAPGLSFKIMSSVTLANTITLTRQNPVTITGKLIITPDALATSVVAKAGLVNIVFGAASLAGDYLEIFSDGDNWFVNGSSSVAAGFA